MKYDTKLVIYPGRFQPFGSHHNTVYSWLKERFKTENVFIATSNKTDFDSPLTFEEKREVIRKFHIPDNRIVQVKNPYKSEEIISQFDPNTTSVIFAYGEKDFDRIKFEKADGSPGYFKPYRGQENLEPLSQCGYAIQVPHAKFNGNEISGTWLRQTLPMCRPEEFRRIMGWYDEEIHAMFKKKFHPEITEVFNSINKTPKVESIKKFTEPKMEDFKQVFENIAVKKYSKHICHPFEDDSLTIGELKDLVNDLLVDTKNIDHCSAKFDGHNYQVTYKDGQVLASRNKSTVINPMTIDQVREKYAGKGDLVTTFGGAHEAISSRLLKFGNDQFLKSVFNNGRTFLNFEILHPLVRNIYEYGEIPIISLHSLITYDERGNEVGRTNSLPEFQGNSGDWRIKKTPKLPLVPLPEINAFYQKQLGKFNPTDLVKGHPQLKKLVLAVGNHILSQYNRSDDHNIAKIKQIILNCQGIGDQEKFTEAMRDLNQLGGIKSINSIEGCVIYWRDKIYKLTGTFAALVPIFSIYNKDRYK